jgi:hypothetical protein
MLHNCVPAELTEQWIPANFEDFVRAVSDGFRSICRSDRWKREKSYMKSLGAGDLFINEFNASRK